MCLLTKGGNKMKITFCIYNESRNQVIHILRNRYPELEISITSCIYCCGECSDKPIARIKGELLVADTPEELITEIIGFIK